MTTKVKKTRKKLKKWFVILLSFLIVGALIGLFFVILSLKKSYAINSDSKIDNNVVIYKDGFYYEDLSSNIIDKITGVTFPSEFDSHYSSIDYKDLKYVRVKYYDFDGIEHTSGEMIVNSLIAQDVVEIFYELYKIKYPISKIVLVDEYDGDDELSMEDNNSSCFNYRIVENIDRLSWHAFGLAIDINPLYNPYVANGEIYPIVARDYVDRDKDFVGKIDHDDLAYKIFIEHGWKWGGDFTYVKDYQHFYKEIIDDSIRERKD